jgi:hypothetical protein
VAHQRFASAACFRLLLNGEDKWGGFIRAEFSGIGADDRGELIVTRAFSGDVKLRDFLRTFNTLHNPKFTLSLIMLDAQGEPVGKLVMSQAKPLRWGISPLDAQAEGLVTESLTIGFGGVSVWTGG